MDAAAPPSPPPVPAPAPAFNPADFGGFDAGMMDEDAALAAALAASAADFGGGGGGGDFGGGDFGGGGGGGFGGDFGALYLQLYAHETRLTVYSLLPFYVASPTLFATRLRRPGAARVATACLPLSCEPHGGAPWQHAHARLPRRRRCIVQQGACGLTGVVARM